MVFGKAGIGSSGSLALSSLNGGNGFVFPEQLAVGVAFQSAVLVISMGMEWLI